MSLYPVGAILIPGDVLPPTSHLPAIVISSSIGTPLGPAATISPCEAGDMLPSGTFAIAAGDPVTHNTTSIKVYDSQLNVLANVLPITGTFWDPLAPVRTDGINTFFVFYGPTATLYTVSATGVVGGTTWTPTLSGLDIECMAPSRDHTILYYGSPEDTTGTIARWNLSTNMALSPLVVFGPDICGQDMFVLASGELLVMVDVGGSGASYSARRYATDGTLNHTYAFGDVGEGSAPVLALDPSDPSVFWVRMFPTVDSTTTVFSKIKLSDGTIETTFTVPNISTGIPLCCPFLIFQQPVGPVVTTTTYPVRRLRQTAHLSDEQVRLFFSKFQLDCQSGIGLNAGQGSDPQVMLSWSDDGGHTWSAERWMSAGPQGEYKRRVIWRQLGSSRDRVWRIVVSDPVAWRLLTAYIDAAKGTS